MGCDSFLYLTLFSSHKMKLLLIYITTVLAAVQSQPTLFGYDVGQRYIYFPDGEGQMHLVDLQQEVTAAESRIESGRIRYFLFTRDNPTQWQELYLNNPATLASSHFVANRPVKFIVHGWRSSGTAAVNTLITSANLHHADVNVIVVDWSAYSGSLNYNSAARNVPGVGAVVSEFIDFLNTQGVPFANIHLVGFSLGGHLVGSAARNAKLGRIPRVTSLDPAGPQFGPENVDRISPNDADYVEIIHTNGDYLGNGDLLGHVDYYPNGGRLQPGCLLSVSCSHSRAYEMFAETIENENFQGIRCDNEDDAKRERCYGDAEHYMGGAWKDKSGDGVFYLATNNRSPFALV